MGVVEDILSKFGVDFDALSSSERGTLMQMLEAVESSVLTIDGLKDFVHSLKDSVEQDLIKEPEFLYVFFFKVLNRKQIYLKARLQNLLLLEAFLLSPERARIALEQALSALQTSKSQGR